MANPRELRNARRKAKEAAESLRHIESLPRRAGQSVRWSNGVVWTRAGDDDWRANTMPEQSYSSAHVASGAWVPVSEGSENDG